MPFALPRSMMGQQGTHQHQSWLSLVAETAGVPGATVARVEIQGDSALGGSKGRSLPSEDWVRAIIQIRDDFGSVVGAASWEGSARELADGVTVDVGCDLSATAGSHVVGWIHAGTRPVDAASAFAPWDAASHSFDLTQAMKLMLNSPFRRAIAASSAAPQFAA